MGTQIGGDTPHRRLLLRPPALRTSEIERSSSWLELFFDLIFVIAVTQLGLALAADLSIHGYLRFGVLFVPVWWAWVGYTNYADRFDSDDVAFRLVVLGAMLAMSVVALAIPDAFGYRSRVFAGAYVAVRVLLVLLYTRARRHVPEARPLCDTTITVFVIGTALWLTSLAVPEPWRFLAWGLALVVEGLTPWVARRAMTAVQYHASHLPERYGLFTLIVLGESLVAVVVGVHSSDWQVAAVTAAALGFVCAAALWWLYFDGIDRDAVGRSLLARNTFIYGHLVVAVGLTMAGVGIKEAILHAHTGHLAVGGQWALCAGPSVMLVALAGLRRTAGRGSAFAVEACVAGLLLAAGALGGSLPPLALVGLVAAVLTVAAAARTVSTG